MPLFVENKNGGRNAHFSREKARRIVGLNAGGVGD
jgi:hypothetical protein